MQAMKKVRGMIRTGEVMPGRYMKKACDLMLKRFKSLKPGAIRLKWKTLVESGQALPVVAQVDLDMQPRTPTPVPRKRKRLWSAPEVQIFEDVVSGDTGLLSEIPGV